MGNKCFRKHKIETKRFYAEILNSDETGLYTSTLQEAQVLR